MKHYLKLEPWGYSLWNDGRQYGAGVGVPWAFLHGNRDLSIVERRIYRKHRLIMLP